MNRDESLLPSRKILRWYYVIPAVVIIAIVAIGLIIWLVTRQPSGTLPYPIPVSEAKELGYDIYYPAQKLLPSGYYLNKNSFVINGKTLIYTVSYGDNNKIVFSDESKPSNAQIQEFYTKDMPIHSTFSTQYGTATLGAINTRALVSLPTNTNAWLLVTAPGNTNQSDFEQVINSIKLARSKVSFHL